ncbi:Xaa-Pro peptidase family protein [Sphingomonas sp.]|uniref:M24 family metallopeptidase n=1 Tax=Sphingomonas sp. TaxID=28214 RepID=UPI0025F1E626|nr:Xaa-Pro peptidase family protein [Sphingomonas sp.]MBV9529152.1 aminopeptidase P family protein [Sphingomonas sp.]
MIQRRSFLTGAAAATAALTMPFERVRAAAADELAPVPAPPSIAPAERMQRIARARQLMQQAGIGAVVVEAGSSLDYLTGIQWFRSERLTAAVIPAHGDPIIVTPFFESPSVEETLAIPAEVRTWNEDEDPLRLVADFLRQRGVAAEPVGFEETDRYFIVDRLSQNLAGLKAVSANPVVRALRLIKSPAELALMQAANDLTLKAMRHAGERARIGMTPADFSAAIDAATQALGGSPEFSLVLIDEASALPHGSKKPQVVKQGSTILFDCGCTLRGYQSDISRTFVFDADPTAEQRKVWNQVHEGQQIAIRAAKIGVAAGAVDDAVRAAYTSWGYGPGYKLPGLPHRTGHGIGMDGHEPVYLVHGEATPLAPGMCFSDEPGIYIPGKFGVRLEDCWHMTEAGPKFFTQPPPSIDRPFG